MSLLTEVRQGCELKEVKKGKTGKGLLIERDGFVAGNESMIRQINEDKQNHKEFPIPDRFIVSAVFQKYGVKNANGRIYPENILKREVEKYIKEKVRTNSAIGALNHPSSSELSLHDVTHKIIELEWVGRTLVGELELHLSPGYRRYGICSTSGDLAANLILDNILIGVSSRAVGSVNNQMGSLIVGDDLELICFDVVAEPSTHNAYISTNREGLRDYIEEDTAHNVKDNQTLSRILSILER